MNKLGKMFYSCYVKDSGYRTLHPINLTERTKYLRIRFIYDESFLNVIFGMAESLRVRIKKRL